MKGFLKVYRNLLARFPVGSQAIQTGLLMGSGDLIAQVFIEKKPLTDFELNRIGRFTVVGTFFVGPSLRIWYGVMDRYLGSKGKLTALKKVALDQLFFAPFFLAAIMVILSAAQNHSVYEVKKHLVRDYLDILICNYKVWPAVQLCNFYFVPLHFQVPTVQIIAIFWNTYLSWKMNKVVNL